MEISERLVIDKPDTIRRAGLKRLTTWTKHAILSGLWKIRRKVMDEKGVDIFQVYEMTDCIEIRIEGDINTISSLTREERLEKIRTFKKFRRR